MKEREITEEFSQSAALLSLHDELPSIVGNDETARNLTRPYLDSRLLLSRISSESRLFRRASNLNMQTETAFRTDNDEDILAVLDALADARKEFMPKNNPVATTLSVLTSASALHRIHDSIFPKYDQSRTQSFMTFNSLTTLDMRNTAMEIPNDQLMLNYQVAEHITSMLSQIAATTPDQQTRIDSGVLEYYTRIVKNRFVTAEYVRRLPGEDAETPSYEMVQDDSQQISSLFQEMQETRRFGMKMGYIPDPRGGSFVFGNIQNLTFAPGLDTHRMINQMYHSSEAIVVHSQNKNFKNIRIKTKELGDENTLRTSTIDLSELNPINDLHLGKDGELYGDATCNDSLLSMAVESGKYTAYRDLQATILSHYYDLTHPYEEVAAIKKKEKSISFASTRQTDEPTELISKLVIPRVNYRYEVATEDENNDSESDTSDENEGSYKTVRLHDVTWHIRKLPEGWNASPEALELARQINVTLAQGETIVKEHTRGSKLLGQVVGHKLIQRG